MNPKKVLIIETDLFFTSRITNVLKQIGLEAVVENSLPKIQEHLKGSEFILIILDLLSDAIDTVTFAERLKTTPSTSQIPVIAFAEHTETELLQKARDAGCEIVVNNRGLVQDLKDLVDASLA